MSPFDRTRTFSKLVMRSAGRTPALSAGLAGRTEVTRRPPEAGESLASCLVRELREELNVWAVVGREVLRTSHDYPDRRVELHFFECQIDGLPVPQQGQEMRWVPRRELATLDFPLADAELITWLTGQKAGP